jgi:UDP-N-acetylmuramate: L-alanyl-gamma-D-glutamyl-meso-diaminopimelate ligase
VFNQRSELEGWLKNLDYKNSVVVFMSSGNYDGLDTEGFARQMTLAAD